MKKKLKKFSELVYKAKKRSKINKPKPKKPIKVSLDDTDEDEEECSKDDGKRW